jgi:hypothetical protein
MWTGFKNGLKPTNLGPRPKSIFLYPLKDFNLVASPVRVIVSCEHWKVNFMTEKKTYNFLIAF